MRDAIERVIVDLESQIGLCEIVLESDEDDRETRTEKEAYEFARDKLKAVLAEDDTTSHRSSSTGSKDDTEKQIQE